MNFNGRQLSCVSCGPRPPSPDDVAAASKSKKYTTFEAIGCHGHSHGLEGNAECAIDIEPLLPGGLTYAQNPRRNDMWRLAAATSLAFLFMLVEIAGGLMAGSLAVLSDAFHLGMDVASYMLGLVAVYYSLRPGNRVHTYGYHRADVLGSLFAILLLWVLTVGLIFAAGARVVNILTLDPARVQHTDGKMVIVVSSFGIIVNVLLLAVLGGQGTGAAHLHSHDGGAGGHGHSHGAVGGAGAGAGVGGAALTAAYMHAVCDLLQSVGVLFTGVVIHVRPSWQLADPVATLVTSRP